MISILESFEEFYYEILRQKEKALRMSEPEIAADDDVDHALAAHRNLVHGIQERLLHFFSEQTEEFSKHIGLGASHYKDAQYVMVVFADEVFLNLPWPGAKYWERSILEGKLFQTQIAGELFFKKLDMLMRSPNALSLELLHVYYFALTLGFKGQLRDPEDQKRINWYIEQIYTLLERKPPQLYGPHHVRLINQCTEYTISDPPGRGLPDVRMWTLCIVGVVVVYVFSTYVAWYGLASDMHEALSEILNQTRIII